MSKQKNILALDMSCGEIAVCVLRDESTFFSPTPCLPDQGRMRSTMIVPLMRDLLTQADLEWSQLDVLALGAGPGSFTGLRIAAATLAGINSALKLPVMQFSSLAITAAQVESAEAIWVLEDARAGEAFVACYDGHQALYADACMRWSDVEALEVSEYCCHAEPPVDLFGGLSDLSDLSGWVRKPLRLSRNEALAIETQYMSQQQRDCLRYPSPVYLQVSQAERNARVSA